MSWQLVLWSVGAGSYKTTVSRCFAEFHPVLPALTLQNYVYSRSMPREQMQHLTNCVSWDIQWRSIWRKINLKFYRGNSRAVNLHESTLAWSSYRGHLYQSLMRSTLIGQALRIPCNHNIDFALDFLHSTNSGFLNNHSPDSGIKSSPMVWWCSWQGIVDIHLMSSLRSLPRHGIRVVF